jgi:hypothetical protein
MPRLADVAADRARYQPFVMSAASIKVGVTPKVQRVKRRFELPKLTAAERRPFLDKYGPVLSLQEAAAILGLSPATLKRQLSEEKYANWRQAR